RQFIIRVLGRNQYTNFGLSSSNQTTGLNIGSSTLTTSNSSGTASLQYDNLTPGTPEFLNSFNANFSDGASAPVSLSTTNSIGVSIGSLGTFPLIMQLQGGTISNVTFTSSGGSDYSLGPYAVPGTLNLNLNGHIEGFLQLPLGLGNLDIGNLYTLPNTP